MHTEGSHYGEPYVKTVSQGILFSLILAMESYLVIFWNVFGQVFRERTTVQRNIIVSNYVNR